MHLVSTYNPNLYWIVLKGKRIREFFTFVCIINLNTYNQSLALLECLTKYDSVLHCDYMVEWVVKIHVNIKAQCLQSDMLRRINSCVQPNS